jgi:hypothetical protein
LAFTFAFKLHSAVSWKRCEWHIGQNAERKAMDRFKALFQHLHRNINGKSSVRLSGQREEIRTQDFTNTKEEYFYEVNVT